MGFRFISSVLLTACCLGLTHTQAWSQVVKLRLETADLEGNPIDSIVAGEDFLLQAYAQQVAGWTDAARAV